MKRKTVDQALRSIRNCGDEMASSAGDIIHILGENGSRKVAEVLIDILDRGALTEAWAIEAIRQRKKTSAKQRRRERKFIR